MRPRVFGNLDDGIYWLKKDDEEENTIIGTHTRDAGGITVATLENDQVLWSLQDVHYLYRNPTASEQNYVSHFQYYDFNRAFLACEKDSSFHVWRRCRNAIADPLYPQHGPSPLQQDVPEKSTFTTLSSSQDNRGVFVPCIVITPRQRPYNFHLLYPTHLISTMQQKPICITYERDSCTILLR